MCLKNQRDWLDIVVGSEKMKDIYVPNQRVVLKRLLRKVVAMLTGNQYILQDTADG